MKNKVFFVVTGSRNLLGRSGWDPTDWARMSRTPSHSLSGDWNRWLGPRGSSLWQGVSRQGWPDRDWLWGARNQSQRVSQSFYVGNQYNLSRCCHCLRSAVEIRGGDSNQPVSAKHVLTCAGLYSDRIAKLTGCPGEAWVSLKSWNFQTKKSFRWSKNRAFPRRVSAFERRNVKENQRQHLSRPRSQVPVPRIPFHPSDEWRGQTDLHDVW